MGWRMFGLDHVCIECCSRSAVSSTSAAVRHVVAPQSSATASGVCLVWLLLVHGLLLRAPLQWEKRVSARGSAYCDDRDDPQVPAASALIPVHAGICADCNRLPRGRQVPASVAADGRLCADCEEAGYGPTIARGLARRTGRMLPRVQPLLSI
jgi:hypothetical protein